MTIQELPPFNNVSHAQKQRRPCDPVSVFPGSASAPQRIKVGFEFQIFLIIQIKIESGQMGAPRRKSRSSTSVIAQATVE